MAEITVGKVWRDKDKRRSQDGKDRIQRLTDLVRYSRHALHTDNLISNEEFSELLQERGSVARLHTYDEMRTELATLREANSRLRGVCAEAYQLAGAVGAPETTLDNLSAAAHGADLPHTTFLPITDDDCSVFVALREALEQFKTHSETNARLYERVEYLGAPLTNPSGEPFDELSQALQSMPTWSELTALREEAKRPQTAPTHPLDGRRFPRATPTICICEGQGHNPDCPLYQTPCNTCGGKCAKCGEPVSVEPASDTGYRCDHCGDTDALTVDEPACQPAKGQQ